MVERKFRKNVVEMWDSYNEVEIRGRSWYRKCVLYGICLWY